MYPINSVVLANWFAETGWELLEKVDLSNEYVKWYKDFLSKLVKIKNEILEEFTEDAYLNVFETFSILLKNINKKIIGGAVFYAKKIKLEKKVAC